MLTYNMKGCFWNCQFYQNRLNYFSLLRCIDLSFKRLFCVLSDFFRILFFSYFIWNVFCPIVLLVFITSANLSKMTFERSFYELSYFIKFFHSAIWNAICFSYFKLNFIFCWMGIWKYFFWNCPIFIWICSALSLKCRFWIVPFVFRFLRIFIFAIWDVVFGLPISIQVSSAFHLCRLKCRFSKGRLEQSCRRSPICVRPDRCHLLFCA